MIRVRRETSVVHFLVASLLAIASIVVPVHAQSASGGATGASLISYRITPSSTGIPAHGFDEPHYVVFDPTARPDAPLLVFLPGTGGRPLNTSEFANIAAQQGYRVIGLEYEDTPAVAQVCPRDPDPQCSEKVRRKRIYGDDVTSLVSDLPDGSVVARLIAVLTALDRSHADQRWSQYLRDGKPDWSRIAVSGLSQGAGMAAYIAQQSPVARAILFSSPWDNYGPRRTLAPWVTRGVGATPSDRWFAAYHEKENTADVIVRAYAALGISKANVRAFTLEPAVSSGANPYHPSVVGNGATPRGNDGQPAYADQWRAMLGNMR